MRIIVFSLTRPTMNRRIPLLFEDISSSLSTLTERSCFGRSIFTTVYSYTNSLSITTDSISFFSMKAVEKVCCNAPTTSATRLTTKVHFSVAEGNGRLYSVRNSFSGKVILFQLASRAYHLQSRLLSINGTFFHTQMLMLPQLV